MDISEVSDSGQFVVFTFGGGVNGWSMALQFIERKLPIDLVLFADTGSEHPHTYHGVEIMDQILKSNGYPGVTIVKTVNRKKKFEGLKNMCMRLQVLPSIAYGWKTCSQRYKIEPQDKFLNNHEPVQRRLDAGEKIIKIVGYDADEDHRIKDYSCDKYETVYPLVDWDYTREDCTNIIIKSGHEVLGKSSCTFCPHMKKHQIIELKDRYPDLIGEALELEANWLGGDKRAETGGPKGLGRTFNWREFLEKHENTPYVKEEQIELDFDMPCGCYD